MKNISSVYIFRGALLYASFCTTNMRCSIGGNGGITVGNSGLGVIGKSVVDFIKHFLVVTYGLGKITCTPPPPTLHASSQAVFSKCMSTFCHCCKLHTWNIYEIDTSGIFHKHVTRVTYNPSKNKLYCL